MAGLEAELEVDFEALPQATLSKLQKLTDYGSAEEHAEREDWELDHHNKQIADEEEARANQLEVVRVEAAQAEEAARGGAAAAKKAGGTGASNQRLLVRDLQKVGTA